MAVQLSRKLVFQFVLPILFGTTVGLGQLNPKFPQYLSKKSEGGVVITGGYPSIAATQTFGTESLPDLPSKRSDHTLSLVGDVLYNCGGRNGNMEFEANCLTLDTTDSEPQWSETITLPTDMVYQTASVVSHHIWFIYENHLYDYDTLGGYFKRYSLPFPVSFSHCAVTTGSHVFVFGVGDNKREIWTNSFSGEPSDWTYVQQTAYPREESACLYFRDNVYITGGTDEGSGEVGPTLEIFDVLSHNIRTAAQMPNLRLAHRMFVQYGGYPAVIGGQSETEGFCTSTLVYDIANDEWSTDLSRNLTYTVEHFGLAQFP